jgi:hypothetical protein
VRVLLVARLLMEAIGAQRRTCTAIGGDLDDIRGKGTDRRRVTDRRRRQHTLAGRRIADLTDAAQPHPSTMLGPAAAAGDAGPPATNTLAASAIHPRFAFIHAPDNTIARVCRAGTQRR